MSWLYRYIKQKSQKNIEAWNCEERWESTMLCTVKWILPVALLLSACDPLTGQVDWLSHSFPLWIVPSFSLALLSCSMGTMLLMVLLLWQIIRFWQQGEGTKLPPSLSETYNWVGSSECDIRKDECTLMINAKRSDMKLPVLRLSLGPLHYSRPMHNQRVSAH